MPTVTMDANKEGLGLCGVRRLRKKKKGSLYDWISNGLSLWGKKRGGSGKEIKKTISSTGLSGESATAFRGVYCENIVLRHSKKGP